MKLIFFILVLFTTINATARFRSVTAVPFFHVLQLEGRAWKTNFQADVLDTASIEILFQTGSKQVSVRMEYEAEGAGDTFVFEAPTVSANGTILPILNMNRNFTTIPLSTSFTGPTLTGDGIILDKGLIPGDAKKGEFGGNIRGGIAILKPNTKYLCRITNVSGGTASYIVRMFFAEKD